MKIFFLAAASSALSVISCAQGSAVMTVKQTADFEVTGNQDNAHWNTTAWIPLEKRKGETTYLTRAKLLYSPTGLYALFACDDRKITATMTEDFANLWTEDVVELFLWTDQSAALYFEYELSPLNHELPILVPNMDGDFLGWRPWQYEGARKTRHAARILRDQKGNTTGWTAEFFIPYALLKPLRNVPPATGSEWRINMYRVDYDNGYTSWSWVPVAGTFHDYEKFGVIRFE